MEKLIFIPNKPEKKLNGIAIREEDIDMDFFKNTDDLLIEMVVRSEGEFAEKAVLLPNEFNYVIGLDKEGSTLLIALKKKQNV